MPLPQLIAIEVVRDDVRKLLVEAGVFSGTSSYYDMVGLSTVLDGEEMRCAGLDQNLRKAWRRTVRKHFADVAVRRIHAAIDSGKRVYVDAEELRAMDAIKPTSVVTIAALDDSAFTTADLPYFVVCHCNITSRENSARTVRFAEIVECLYEFTGGSTTTTLQLR